MFLVIYFVYVVTVVAVSCLVRHRENRALARSLTVGLADDEFMLGPYACRVLR